ncbi:MAG TPA: hypothetical protein VHE79_05310 [Spirochaetia bacterium]
MKRLGILLSISLVLLSVAGAVSFAQSKGVAVTTTVPVIDGVVNPGEYSFSQDFGQMTLYVNRTADALDVAVVGKTAGWVGVGLGSMRMDGSTIFMGYVTSEGKSQFQVQAGQGHGHSNASSSVAATVASYALKESGGVTTLEVKLKPADYVKTGAKALQVIYAQGSEKSFRPRHVFRGAVSVALL